MHPYWVFRFLPELSEVLPLFGRSSWIDPDSLFEWKSLRFWKFILVYRLND